MLGEAPYVHWANTKAGVHWGGGDGIAVTPEGGLWLANNSALIQFSPRGDLIQSNHLAGAYLSSVATDAAGNLYVAGNVTTNGYFDSPAVQGFFLAKYRPTGELAWVRNTEVTPDMQNWVSVYRIMVDAAGNAAVGGSAKGRFKLGPVENSGDENADSPFFCKFDPNGRPLWAKRVESQYVGQFPGGTCYDIALDGAGNLIVCGFLREASSDFGGMTVYPGTSGYSYNGDWFLAKYGPAGQLVWAQLGYATSLAVDQHGDIYAAFDWAFQGTGGIAKLNGHGDLLWKKDLPAYVDWPQGLALDETGQPIFTGEVGGTVNFDGIPLKSKSITNSDFFIAKANAQGNILWAITGGGMDWDRGERVASAPNGVVYLTSVFRNAPCEFDGLINLPRSNAGTPTLLVSKLSERPSLQITPSPGGIEISWPAKATNYLVETSGSFLAPWSSPNATPAVSGRTQRIQVDSSAEDSKFYRLRRTP